MPTINGLAIALGIGRNTLNEYRHRPEFQDTLKRVLAEIEEWWEKRLAENSCTGAIFWLKNQGWKDKITTEQDLTIHQPKQTFDELEAELREAAKTPGIKAFLETLKQ